MANWKAKILVGDYMRRAQAGELPLNDLSKIFIDELNHIPFELVDAELDDIIVTFKDLSMKIDVTETEFNNVLERLYDWADTDKRLWVEPRW
jgi:hypothetical protein